MISLNLPKYPFKIIEEENGRKIWDEIRKKYVSLTPEEWVRQNTIQFLHREKSFPLSLIKVESGLKVNSLYRRTDLLVYSKTAKPVFLVECKSADVKITQEVFDQIARYNIPLMVPYLMVTNGLDHYCCLVDYKSGTYTFLKEIPNYPDLEMK